MTENWRNVVFTTPSSYSMYTYTDFNMQFRFNYFKVQREIQDCVVIQYCEVTFHLVSIRKMKKDKKEQTKRELKYHLAGWILFIICAVFFIASSLKNHDTLTFIGSIIFLIACVVFLIPLFQSSTIKDDDTLR